MATIGPTPVGAVKFRLLRLLQRMISAVAWAGDGVRRIRYRRAELLRISPAETVADGATADEAFRWIGATSVRGRPHSAVMCAPGSRITYSLTLPADAVVTSWCRLAVEAMTQNVGGVEVELRLRTERSESSATCRLVPAASRIGRRWRRLRVHATEAGTAQIVLITRPANLAAMNEPCALWGSPRVEWPRSLAQLMTAGRAKVSEEGIRGLWHRSLPPGPERLYRLWARAQEPSRSELRGQRKRVLGSQGSQGSPACTLITFVEEAARWRPGHTAESVLKQSDPRWDWILLADEESMPALERSTARLRRDERVRLIGVPRATRAEALNTGLAAARGEFVALVDQHDRLAPDALYEMTRALGRSPGCDLLYSDEDRWSSDSRTRHDPHLKPDWSPELLVARNYIGRLAMIRVSAATASGGFRNGDISGGGGSAVAGGAVAGGDVANPIGEGFDIEWDLFLRLTSSTDRIQRVPRCLYHRDDRDEPPRDDSGDRANRTVLEDYWRRRGVQATVSRVADAYRSVWPVQANPLVSIVIPNRNAAAVFSVCVRGLLHETRYRNHELVIVDNGSTDPEVLNLYRELQAGGHGRIVPFDRPFNFSAACNAGAAAARGDLLLFLNNDIEVIEPDWLDELVRWAERPEIGIVGAKLLYPNRTIQHAGVAFGPGGLVDHIFAKAPEGISGIFGSAESYRNYLAVTGACQMMRADVFGRIGGFDERLRISFSDVILCMEAWKAGYRVVYTPYARLLHHESYTRRREDSARDIELLARYLRSNGFLEDPYFHPQLNPKSLVPVLRPPFDPMPGQLVSAYIERVLATADATAISAHGG